MRVRPIFWLLLVVSCMAALTLAALWPVQVPAVLQVHVAEQVPLRVGIARLQLQLTDPQGTPIEQAQVSSSAWMPDMAMGPTPIHIQQEGHGSYSVLVFFSMPGAWAIKIEARARGFTPQQQILHLEIA
jgi:hypothetical protein